MAEVERLRARLRRQQAGLRAYIDEANGKGKAPVLQRAPSREWAGDMPRIRKTDASRRTMGEFMDGEGVKRTLRARGVSKGAAQGALSEEVRSRGMDPRDFSSLSKTSQREVFRDALSGHAAERMEERGVTREQADDALAHPTRVTEAKVDEQGRRSQKHIGWDATASVNPDTGKTVTVFPTGSRRRRRHGADR